MCLIPLKSKLYTADKDIKVYKVLKVISNKKLVGLYRTGYEWKLNELRKERTRLGGDKSKASVHKGFHASTYLSSGRSVRIGHYNTKLFLAVIPKGSIYKLGIHNDIVSNQMIVKKQIR